jgi:hypothetical protein
MASFGGYAADPHGGETSDDAADRAQGMHYGFATPAAAGVPSQPHHNTSAPSALQPQQLQPLAGQPVPQHYQVAPSPSQSPSPLVLVSPAALQHHGYISGDIAVRPQAMPMAGTGADSRGRFPFTTLLRSLRDNVFRPVVMGAAAAFGMSLGYAMWDWVEGAQLSPSLTFLGRLLPRGVFARDPR